MAHPTTETFKVSQVTLSEDIKAKHTDYIREAESRGEEDGRRNLPEVSASVPTPYEMSLRGKYQAEADELQRIGSPWLQELHDQRFQGLKQQLADIRANPDFIPRQIKTAETDRDRHLREANDNHLDRLKEIENEPSWLQVSDEHRGVLSRFQAVAHRLKREELEVHLALGWELAILLFLGLSEVPLNYQVFVSFRETPLFTLLMASALVVTLPLLAHASGKFLRQHKENPGYLKFFFAIASLMLALSGVTAYLRAGYLKELSGGSGSFAGNFWTFFVLNLVLYAAGILASYMAIDPSIEFSLMHKRLSEVKRRYHAAKLIKDERDQKERERYDQEKRGIQGAFTARKQELDLREQTLSAQLVQAAGEYDATLVDLQGLEKRINNCFKESVHKYRDLNMKHRNNHAQPAYWGQPIADLNFYFARLLELSMNPRRQDTQRHVQAPA